MGYTAGVSLGISLFDFFKRIIFISRIRFGIRAFVADDGEITLAVRICGIAGGVGRAVAFYKRLLADIFHAFGNRNGFGLCFENGQTMVGNALNGAGNDDIRCIAVILIENTVANDDEGFIVAAKPLCAGEGIYADVNDRFGNFDLRELGATGENGIAEHGHAARKFCARNFFAGSERTVFNGFECGGEGNGF